MDYIRVSREPRHALVSAIRSRSAASAPSGRPAKRPMLAFFFHALTAPAGLLGLCTLEGHFITPAIVGRRSTLNRFLCCYRWRVLDLDVGTDRRLSRRAAGDRRTCRFFSQLFPHDGVKLPD